MLYICNVMQCVWVCVIFGSVYMFWTFSENRVWKIRMFFFLILMENLTSPFFPLVPLFKGFIILFSVLFRFSLYFYKRKSHSVLAKRNSEFFFLWWVKWLILNQSATSKSSMCTTIIYVLYTTCVCVCHK